MLAFWIENWFLCSFFVANLTINSSSLLVIIFIRYHCLLTGVTILGKPRWQEISSKILDTGIYIASEGTNIPAVKGFSPFDSRLKNFTLFDSLSGQNWLLFLWVIAFDVRRTKHILLGFLYSLGILWYSLISLRLLLIKGCCCLFLTS